MFLSVWPHRRADDGAGVLKRGTWIGFYDECIPRLEPFYPFEECGAIYSPHVQVVWTRQTNQWQQQGEPFAVISAAAQDTNLFGPFDRELLKEIIRTVLHIAAIKGHDALVLGAFGCGYFRNPADQVADTFAELLSGEFQGVFSQVLFAILGGREYSIFDQRMQQLNR